MATPTSNWLLPVRALHKKRVRQGPDGRQRGDQAGAVPMVLTPQMSLGLLTFFKSHALILTFAI